MFDDFEDNCLNPNIWLLVNKGWGGENRGVIPENVSIENGILKLKGYGDLHNGITRAGAAIATRHYYASGSYEVRARLAPELGACSAFWTFHYDRKFPDEANYWTDGNPVRNTEIDWEFPTAMSDGRSYDPISFRNLRANSWGGKVGGEGAHHPGRVEADQDLSKGWHVYRFDWHSTGTADDLTPRVEYFIDNKKVYEIRGSTWGQDNIGYRAARFWLGVWFPAAGWKPTGDVGWAGSPQFDTTNLEIDWVKITPLNEERDKWEPELLPNEFYVAPHLYPGYGKKKFPKIVN
ncbi:MAG: glycoside hydrolase family 16 protein [Lentisphaerae bacterium]|nr:glycoside hydrolase family 16 protein [Lentisphaerota bacterium]MCP4101437.1 glycoside hydrolase family 16 protein [Lentisphaerota bacterium]